MLKVLKNLKKSFWSVVIIVISLCIQAKADLALPDYTSKIVNTGIQSCGIETSVPEIISKENMDTILIFTDKDDEILSNYSLIGNNLEKYQEKTIKKYLGNDYNVNPDTLYIVNEISEEEKDKLANILSGPLMEMTTIKNEETANKIKEQMTANMPEQQKALPRSHQRSHRKHLWIPRYHSAAYYTPLTHSLQGFPMPDTGYRNGCFLSSLPDRNRHNQGSAYY